MVVMIENPGNRTNSHVGRGMACHAHTEYAKINEGTACRAPTRDFGKPITGSLSTIIGSYKSAVSKEINTLCETPGNKIWQRNYYDHIIRFDNEFWDIHYYIVRNPEDWEKDIYNPNFHGGYDRKSWEPDE
jgi:putative transposase